MTAGRCSNVSLKLNDMESIFNKRFLDNTEITMNGEVYKNTEAFERKNDEVCYISEYGLQELAEQDHELTDKEIVEKGIGESYNSILEQAKEYWNEFVESVCHPWHNMHS